MLSKRVLSVVRGSRGSSHQYVYVIVFSTLVVVDCGAFAFVTRNAVRCMIATRSRFHTSARLLGMCTFFHDSELIFIGFTYRNRNRQSPSNGRISHRRDT